MGGRSWEEKEEAGMQNEAVRFMCGNEKHLSNICLTELEDDWEFSDESATVGITERHDIARNRLTGVQIGLSPVGGRNV